MLAELAVDENGIAGAGPDTLNAIPLGMTPMPEVLMRAHKRVVGQAPLVGAGEQQSSQRGRENCFSTKINYRL